MAYATWRLRRPDVIGGINRRLRRMRGIYIENSVYDDAEYHVTRNGVDQEAIVKLLRQSGMQVQVLKYWSTQSPFFQSLGSFLGFKSNFAIFAEKTREYDL